MARDTLKTLSTEHDKVRSLFEDIKATTDRAETRASLHRPGRAESQTGLQAGGNPVCRKLS